MNITKLTLLCLIALLITSPLLAQNIATPDGYAGAEGTTGGGDATPITVSTAADFKTAVGNNDPAVIVVEGLLSVGSVNIGSNKTIIGANESSGLTGGVIGVTGDNYIFQNLIFGPSSADAMEISGATRVFVHKCEFHDSSDELLSIVRAADFVTVSWCKFYFDNPDGHSFAHLIGNSDDRTTDRGKLHVTMHHNWYAEGIVERMPRVRFGHVHIYNNYYNSVGNNYCIGTGVECHIRVENSHFDNVNQLWFNWNGVETGGILGWDNLKLDNATLPTYIDNSYPGFDLPYSFGLDPVESVKDIVTAGAGNVFDSNDPVPPTVEITSPQEGAVFTSPGPVSIEASASDSDGSVVLVELYANDNLIASLDQAPYSFSWTDMTQGDYTIQAVATDDDGLKTTSLNVNIEVTGGTLNIPGANLQESYSVFPNPVANDLNVSLSESAQSASLLIIYNNLGQEMHSSPIRSMEFQVDMSRWPRGLYFVFFKNELGESVVRKVVKE